jgi:sensor histidine kinase regulating citrate/malate metabolism
MMETFSLIVVFSLGYIAGSLDGLRRSFRSTGGESSVSSFVTEVNRDQKRQAKAKISIDNSTYVTDISTDGIESKGSPLGTVSQSKDDISSAANKLAQLKKMKG